MIIRMKQQPMQLSNSMSLFNRIMELKKMPSLIVCVILDLFVLEGYKMIFI